MEDYPISPESVISTPSKISMSTVDVKPLRSLPSITLIDRDLKGINPINQDDHMVVSIVIANFMVAKVVVNPLALLQFGPILGWNSLTN